MAENKNIGQLDEGGTILAGDEIPVFRAGVTVRVALDTFVSDSIARGAVITPALSTDLMPVVRDGILCLVTIPDVIAALTAPTVGQFDFSIAGNSGLLAGAL